MSTFRMFLGILQINQVQKTKLTNRNIMVSYRKLTTLDYMLKTVRKIREIYTYKCNFKARKALKECTFALWNLIL